MTNEQRERIKLSMRKRRVEDPWSRRRDQISVIRHRALKKNLEFTLKVEDLEWPKYCPLLGVELNYEATTGDPNSPSVDRLDSTKGYTKENCWIISKRANSIKSDATIEELTLLLENLKKRY